MFLTWSELFDPSASNTSIIVYYITICKLRLQRRCCRLRHWWWAHVVIERARRQGEEGPACRIWSLFKSQCFSLAIPGSCRNTVADTELDLRSLQILRAHFLSDFFLFWVRCRPMKISYSANRSPQNLRWPNFSLYLFISPFPKHLLGQTEPRAGP